MLPVMGVVIFGAELMVYIDGLDGVGWGARRTVQGLDAHG